MKNLKTLLAAAVTLMMATQLQAGDIVDVAASNKSFKTLVAAVKAAGLVETLKSDGPFTVFAPTDEAFAKLPEGTLESLLKPENKQKLVSILTYHVVPGKVMAKDVKSGMVKTASGSSFKMKVSKQGVDVDKASSAKNRLEILEKAEAEDMIVCAGHFPPGLVFGNVKTVDGKRTWNPI